MDFGNFNRKIKIGGKKNTREIEIGGDAPVSIQTMWKIPLTSIDLQETVKELASLEQLGCDIVRFAVPDIPSAEALLKLAQLTHMPLVADIHFDYKLAMRCMDGAVAKIRINPGNIGDDSKVEAVIKKALDTGTAIRIGVNSGSLPADLVKKSETAVDKKKYRAEAMVEAALRELEFFDKHNFKDAVVSMKATTADETVFANEIFIKKCCCPLHLGITEAGPLITGLVKTSIAFYRLLENGIGNTVRVSLSDSPENEVIAAREILYECGKRKGGIRLVSCPRCGRKGFDVHAFVSRWQSKLLAEKKDLIVAVMGCEVNGPGEGKHADIGITGSNNSVLIFKHGKVSSRLNLRGIPAKQREVIIDQAFEKELNSL